MYYHQCIITPPQAGRKGHSVFGLSVNVCVCVRSNILKVCQHDTGYLTNRLWEFHRIYNLGAAVYKDELIRFGGQKVKVQGHDETKYGQKAL